MQRVMGTSNFPLAGHIASCEAGTFCCQVAGRRPDSLNPAAPLSMHEGNIRFFFGESIPVEIKYY
jgi:hypothetical protein